MSSKFLQASSSVFRVVDAADLVSLDRLPAGTYQISQDPRTSEYLLNVVDNMEIPAKLYGDTGKVARRIMHTYQDRTGRHTGILLSGEKGSGKTLLAKTISNIGLELGIPTILVNAAYAGSDFNEFIQSLEQGAIFLFDEFEKVYRDQATQEALLTLLDGTFGGHHMFILTCNDEYRINHLMRDRPGRVFYARRFAGLDSSFVKEYGEENLSNKEHVASLVSISKLFDNFNFDMLKGIVEECNRYNESPMEAIEFVNAKPLMLQHGHSDRRYAVSVTVGGQLLPDECLWSSEHHKGIPIPKNDDSIEINFRNMTKDTVKGWRLATDEEEYNQPEFTSCVYLTQEMLTMVSPSATEILYEDEYKGEKIVVKFTELPPSNTRDFRQFLA